MYSHCTASSRSYLYAAGRRAPASRTLLRQLTGVSAVVTALICSRTALADGDGELSAAAHRANTGGASWQMPGTGPPAARPSTSLSAAPTGYYSPPAPPAPAEPYPPVLRTPIEPLPPDQGEDDESEPPFFDLAVGTYVPLSIGGQASLELPARLLVQGDVGFMPGVFGSAFSGLVNELGVVDADLSSIVDGALSGALVLRLSGGWRPFVDWGFEITGGYTLLALSGSVPTAELAQVVGGEYAAEAAGVTLPEQVDISSQLHNIHVALGWRWVAFEHLIIRASVGYMQTLGSSSEVEIPGQSELSGLANPTVDQTLDDIYTSYVKLPVVGLSGGYRF